MKSRYTDALSIRLQELDDMSTQGCRAPMSCRHQQLHVLLTSVMHPAALEAGYFPSKPFSKRNGGALDLGAKETI